MGVRKGWFHLAVPLVVIFASIVFPPCSRAQTSTGQINITVMDSSGAVIPGANVTISGTDTGNLVRTLKTNGIGVAEAPLLRPMAYTVTVSAPGFQELQRRGVLLQVGDLLELPVTLQPGSTTQQISVVGQTPLIEQNSGTLAQVIGETTIGQLPLNGRNYLNLGNLLPGSVPSHGSRDDTFSMNGNTGIQNAFVLDGARNENYMRGMDVGVSGGSPVVGARDAFRPPVDAISEFSVNSSNYSAEYGAAAGAVILTVTKSGTNQIHGSVYEYNENNHLAARNFFAAPGPTPLLVYNQFGGSLGGPVVKNRAWAFGAYEGTGQGGGIPGFSTVPTAAMRNGNFGSTAIYDPFTTALNPAGSGYVRSQFTNNIIPTNEMSSTGQQLVNRYPLPNLPGLANDYVHNLAQDFYNHNAIFRGDVQLSDKSSLFGRLALARYSLTAEAALSPPAGSPVDKQVHSWGVGYGYTHTFGAALVNEVRFSWTRITMTEDMTLPYNQIIPGTLDPQVRSGIPLISVSGFAGLGSGPGCCPTDPLAKSSGVWDIADNVSRSMGRHLLKFGFDGLYIRPTTFSAVIGRGTMGFSGVFTQNPQSRGGTGSAVADALLGTADTLATGNIAQVVERGHYYGGYFQDDVKLTRNLTANLGLRYEVYTPFIEAHNHMANLIVSPSDPHFGQYIIAGNSAFPRGLLTTAYSNWAPRVGFAYRIPNSSNLVVRGGYGVFYAEDYGEGIVNRMVVNPPFYNYGGVNIISDQVNPSTGLALTPTASAPRLPPISASQFALNPLATSALVAWSTRYEMGNVQEWNLTVEKQLPWSVLWQVSYVGNSATHMYGKSQANQPLTNGPGSPNNRRPLAQYSHAPIAYFSPWNRSHYEGISTELRKRFGSGVSFLFNFTYSNSLDLQNAAEGLCDGCNETVQNSYNLDSLLAHSDQDMPLRLTFSGIWDLPFGPGHRLASGRVAAALVGGWQVNGIYTASSGYPFTPVLSFDNANAGNGSWPNRMCNGQLTNWTLKRYFDTSCFVVPAAYQFGNTGRNVLTGPGYNDVDFGLHRSFRIPVGEGTQVELRGEAFNVFNHPQFAPPGLTVGTATFGVIGATSVANRIVQVALRLTW